MAIKKILILVGGTPFFDSKLATAIELARVHEASLTGMALLDPVRLASVGPVPLGGGAAAADLATHRAEEIETRMRVAMGAFEQACREASVPCEVDLEVGDALRRLTVEWRCHDLVIAGLRGLFEYGLLHDPADAVVEIVDSGIRPILSVAKSYRPVRRVLIAYNGSRQSAAALKTFAIMRPYPDAVIDLVTFDESGVDVDDLRRETGYLEAHGFEVAPHRLEGPARNHLLPTAERFGSDLLVIGATNRSRLARRLLGDTVLTMLKESPIPLWLSQ